MSNPQPKRREVITMTCKSALYTANVSNAMIAAGGTIPFGGVIRRFGRNIDLNGSDISIRGNGYYLVNIAASLTASAAGNATVTLLKDGVAVVGAFATETATEGGVVNIAITALVRETGCSSSSQLSLGLTGIAVSAVNVSTVIEKL